MHAAAKGHHIVVETLLDAGADPEEKSNDGLSALDVATVFEHGHIVELINRRIKRAP